MRHSLFAPNFMRSKLLILSIVTLLILVLSPYIFQRYGGQRHEPFEEIEEADALLGVDEDGDGLSDEAEKWTGTDPNNPDTDDDGLADGVEYQFWSTQGKNDEQHRPGGDIDGDGDTNLMDSDSDGDHLPDGWELQHEFDPGSKDTDGDGIDDFFEAYPVTGDHDGNGLPDKWESKYGLSDPNGDPDGDGLSNLMEYILGQDPTRPGSGIIRPGEPSISSLSDSGIVSLGEDIFRTSNGNAPRYWRLECYADYHNGGWQGQYSYSTKYQAADLSGCSYEGHERYDVEFYGMNQGNLPSPLYPYDIRSIDDETDLVNGSYGCDDHYNLGTDGNIYSYTLETATPDYELSDLENGAVPLKDSQWYDDNEEYYTFYTPYQDDLDELAASLCENEDTPYGKIHSILSYLFHYKVYSGDSTSTVKGFLFQNQTGNSYHFATSFVLLARTSGIPSRLVGGFVNGELTEGYRIFSIDHIHIWAEVYLTDVGWVGVECTMAKEIMSSGDPGRIDGHDPWILQGNPSEEEFELALGGDGGTAFTEISLDYSDVVQLENLDSDMDGITNANDEDDDNDGLTDVLELDIGSNPMTSDTDKDGLTDGDEYNVYETDLFDRDSDNDGLLDGMEVEKYYTDPLRRDSDDGGADDGEEIYYHLDPNDPLDDDWAVDSDGDGLMDGYESEIGSDPHARDTDDGGVSDYWEDHYGYDPMDPDDDPFIMDSDFDGLSDGLEIEIGSDPHKSDTDRGGAEDPIEYRHGGNFTDPDDDDDYIDSDHDGLINSYEEEIGTNKNMYDTDGGGLSDYYELEHGLDPLEDEDDETLDSDGDGLSDKMELDLDSNPFDGDSDNDGLNDYSEKYEYYTDLNDPDSDNDGLSDREEIDIGTDPNDSDSDNDWVSDGLEVAYGTDPNDRDTDGDGLTDGEEFGSYSYYNPLSLEDFNEWISNPTLADSDGDGLTDDWEWEYETNPLAPDSDGDGYSDYWEWEHDWDPGEFDYKPPDTMDRNFPDFEPNDDHFYHDRDFFEEDIYKPPSDTSDFSPDLTMDSSLDSPSIGSPSFGALNSNVMTFIFVGVFVVALIIGYWFHLKRKYRNELKDVIKNAICELDDIERNITGERRSLMIRAAIIKTYKNTLNIMERYNFLKPRSHTPREFALAFERALPEGGKYLNDMTDVFEEARYSDHMMKERHRKKALRCFKRLYKELTTEEQDAEKAAA